MPSPRLLLVILLTLALFVALGSAFLRGGEGTDGGHGAASSRPTSNHADSGAHRGPGLEPGP